MDKPIADSFFLIAYKEEFSLIFEKVVVIVSIFPCNSNKFYLVLKFFERTSLFVLYTLVVLYRNSIYIIISIVVKHVKSFAKE